MRRINSQYRAIIYIILSAFCFAVMNLFVRMSGDIPPFQKSFFRNLVAVVFAAVVLVKQKSGFRWNKGNLKYLLLRSGIGTIGIVCNFYALSHIPLSDASILNKMSPFFVIIFSFFILKERLTFLQGAAVVIAFVGSLFVIKPSFQNVDVIPSAIGLFFLIFDYHPMAWWQILMLLGAGLAATGGQFSITAAYCHAPAREISVYDYSQIIFATLLGVLFLGEVPDIYSFIGYIIIVAMAVLMFLYNNHKPPFRRL